MTDYLLAIVSEPDEPPVRLSQDEFDVLLDVGADGEPPCGSTGGDVFATLSTDPPEADFMWRGHVLSPDAAAVLFATGLSHVLRLAVEERS